MKTAFSIVFLLACLIHPALAYNNQPERYETQGTSRWHWPTYHERNYFGHFKTARRVRKGKRYHHAIRYVARHHYTAHRSGHGISLAGQPAPLVAKVQEIIHACGSHLASGNRPGARVAGRGTISNHALNKADDVAGNPRCIYAHLRGWPGGYSVDYPAVNHVHISYNRSKEWGARFVHGGGHRHYAHRRLRYAGR